MTLPTLKPCPDCGVDAVGLYVYDSGWRRAECDKCTYIAEPAQNLVEAARNHNRRVLLSVGFANAARANTDEPNGTPPTPSPEETP